MMSKRKGTRNEHRSIRLRDFSCSPNCRKLVHRWRDRVRLPDVKEL
jgi:hypothetical protein